MTSTNTTTKESAMEISAIAAMEGSFEFEQMAKQRQGTKVVHFEEDETSECTESSSAELKLQSWVTETTESAKEKRLREKPVVIVADSPNDEATKPTALLTRLGKIAGRKQKASPATTGIAESLSDAAYAYISRLIMQQIASETEDDTDDDEELSRTSDLDSVQAMWERMWVELKKKRKTPPSLFHRPEDGSFSVCCPVLFLPEGLLLDAGCITYLIEEVRKLEPIMRPKKIIVASEIDYFSGDVCANRLAELFQLCGETLERTVLRGQTKDFVRTEFIYSRILGSGALACDNLVHLSLERIYLSPDAIEGLYELFGSQRGALQCRIRSLSIADSLIYNPRRLAPLLEYYGGLEKLSMSGCELGDEQLSYISKAIENSNSHLTHLDISGNCLTPSSITSVTRMMRAQELLRFLDVSRNNLFKSRTGHGKRDKAFYGSVGEHYSLQELRMNACGLTIMTLKPVFTEIERNIHMEHFQFTTELGEITPETMSRWVEALPSIRRLQSRLITPCLITRKVLEHDDYEGHEDLWTDVVKLHHKSGLQEHLEKIRGRAEPDMVDKSTLSSLCRKRLMHHVSVNIDKRERSIMSVFSASHSSFGSVSKSSQRGSSRSLYSISSWVSSSLRSIGSEVGILKREEGQLS